MKLEVHLDGASGTRKHVVELEREGGSYRVVLDGKTVDAHLIKVAHNTISILLGGQSFEVHVTPTMQGNLKLQSGPHEFTAEVQDPRAWRGRKHGGVEMEGRQQVLAPIPGKVMCLLVTEGETVEAGQGLVVIEAMKMQNEIRSPKSGTVARLLAKEGQTVNAADVLAWVE
jgi:biotin carboxyl carrier protein